MKTLSAILFSGLALTAYTQSITTTGNFTFSPDLLTVNAGTPIAITVGGAHTMTEVSESTWNVNGTTSNGGFNYDGGNHTLTLDIPGTYYYICVPHAGLGMKGRIIVESTTNVTEANNADIFQLFPNPANDGITITVAGGTGMMLRLIDMEGREVLDQILSGNDRISIAHLAKGTYMALIEDGTGAPLARRPLTITR